MSPQPRPTVQKASQRSSRSGSPASRGPGQMASRAARRIERSLPWPAMVLAVLAIVFFALPLAGLISRAPWSECRHDPAQRSVREALKLSIICSLCATVAVGAPRPPAGLAARAAPVRRPIGRACPVHACRWCCPPWSAASLCCSRSVAAGWSVSGSIAGSTSACHSRRRRRDRPDVRRHALLRRHGRGSSAPGRRRPRRGGAHPRRQQWYSFRRVTLPAIRSALSPARCCRGPVRSGSSEPPSRSPAAFPARRRRCRCRCTSRSIPTRNKQSCSRC